MIPQDKRDPFTDPSVHAERYIASLESQVKALTEQHKWEVEEHKRVNRIVSDREIEIENLRAQLGRAEKLFIREWDGCAGDLERTEHGSEKWKREVLEEPK